MEVQSRTMNDGVLAILCAAIWAGSVPGCRVKKRHITSFDRELYMPRHGFLRQDVVVRIRTLGQSVNILTIGGHPKRVARIKRECVAAWHKRGAAPILVDILKVLHFQP